MELLWKNYHNREDFFSPQRPQSAQRKNYYILNSFFVSFVPFVVEYGCG